MPSEEKFRVIRPLEVLAFLGTSLWIGYLVITKQPIPGNAGSLSWMTRAIDPVLFPLSILFLRFLYWGGGKENWVFAFLILDIVLTIALGSFYGLMLCTAAGFTYVAIHRRE